MKVFNKNMNLQMRFTVTKTADMSHHLPFSVVDHVPKFWDEYFHAELSI